MHLRNLLVTGVPGIGKTTVLRHVGERISGVELRGFLTAEIRTGGRRVGFSLETFCGESATLAHVELRSQYRVGPYRVDVPALDRIVERALGTVSSDAIYLIDEIGKMECFSHKFVDAVSKVLNSDSTVVATIARKGRGFIERVKKRPDVDLWEVTPANRDTLPRRIYDRVVTEHR